MLKLRGSARQGSPPAGQNTELMVCSSGGNVGLLNLARVRMCVCVFVCVQLSPHGNTLCGLKSSRQWLRREVRTTWRLENN